MNIQKSNNITASDIEIKVEKESPTEENFSLKDCPFVKHETVVFKTEEDTFHELTESKLNGNEIVGEHFNELKYIVPEEIDIKNEVHEEDHFSTNKFEHEIKEEYFDGPESIAHEDFVIKTEDQEEYQSESKYEENTTRKGERKYCCDKCSYETRKKSHLNRHTQIHDKINALKYACNQCPYQTICKSALKGHLRTHSSFGLSCILCQRSFTRKSNLDSHYVTRHPDRSDKWGSTITHKINECPKCLYKTVRASHFKDHLMTHEALTYQPQFKCNICGYTCMRKNHFTSHLRIHVGELPFMCIECDTKFNSKQQLDGHILFRHSENEELINSVTSKVHQCDKCAYKTVQNTHFKRHLKKCL